MAKKKTKKTAKKAPTKKKPKKSATKSAFKKKPTKRKPTKKKPKKSATKKKPTKTAKRYKERSGLAVRAARLQEDSIRDLLLTLHGTLGAKFPDYATQLKELNKDLVRLRERAEEDGVSSKELDAVKSLNKREFLKRVTRYLKSPKGVLVPREDKPKAKWKDGSSGRKPIDGKATMTSSVHVRLTNDLKEGLDELVSSAESTVNGGKVAANDKRAIGPAWVVRALLHAEGKSGAKSTQNKFKLYAKHLQDS